MPTYDEKPRHVSERALSTPPARRLGQLVRRAGSGVLSQLGAYDPEAGGLTEALSHNLARAWRGQPANVHAGVIDEAKALPVLWRDVGPLAAMAFDKLAGGVTGHELYGAPDGGTFRQDLEGSFVAPDWAEDAEAQAGRNMDAARATVGVEGEPHGLLENLAESGGVMAGQIPLPGSVLRRLRGIKAMADASRAEKVAAGLGKVAGSGVEYLSPTIDPSLANYGAGTAFGGVTGAIADYLGGDIDAEQE